MNVVTIFPTFLVTVRHVLPPPAKRETEDDQCKVTSYKTQKLGSIFNRFPLTHGPSLTVTGGEQVSISLTLNAIERMRARSSFLHEGEWRNNIKSFISCILWIRYTTTLNDYKGGRISLKQILKTFLQWWKTLHTWKSRLKEPPLLCDGIQVSSVTLPPVHPLSPPPPPQSNVIGPGLSIQSAQKLT